jgi:hypothetical protein
MAIDPQTAAVLRTHKNELLKQSEAINQLMAVVNSLASRPKTVWDEINAIPGRWIESTLSGEVTFTAAEEGSRGTPILFLVSQDGPFIMTHYPLCLWRPTAPNPGATNLNRWRPVTTFPLPDQVVDTDIIDIKYELQDGGSGRDFQNEPRAPLLSRPDNIVPCPTPTVWSPNATIKFTPTYLALTWNSATPPTQGTLHVDIPGFRIVNL